MSRIAGFCLVTTVFLFSMFLNSQVFASTNEVIKKELKKRMDSISWAYEIKEYERGHKESKELNNYILKNWNKAVPVLIEILNDEKEKFGYKMQAMGRLGKLKAKESSDTIAKYLSDAEGNRGLVMYAIMSLSNIGNEKSVNYLINYYKSFLKGLNKGYERAIVIRELSKYENEEVIELFIKALSDIDSSVRLFAVKALGEWKIKKAIIPLKRLIKTEYSPEVKDAINKSLEKIYSDEKEK